MARRGMTVDAAYGVRVGQIPHENVIHHILMTIDTVALQDLLVLFLYYDGFMKILHRECPGMIPAVFRFRHIFAHKAVRQVAVDAGRDRVVARLLPRVVLGVHDVTVGASLRILAQVGQALGVAERRPAEADQHTHHGAAQRG